MGPILPPNTTRRPTHFIHAIFNPPQRRCINTQQLRELAEALRLGRIWAANEANVCEITSGGRCRPPASLWNTDVEPRSDQRLENFLIRVFV